jgi:hypothetical protein
MNSPAPTTPTRRAVRRLLAAVDRALAAAREVEQARRELTRVAERAGLVRLAPEGDGREDDPPAD